MAKWLVHHGADVNRDVPEVDYTPLAIAVVRATYGPFGTRYFAVAPTPSAVWGWFQFAGVLLRTYTVKYWKCCFKLIKPWDI